jgi:alcohol dehydrogenase
MKVPQIIDDLESRIINTLKLSRFKNQIVGKGYVTGLKAVTYLLNIPKPTVFMGRGASLRLAETVAQFGLKRLLIVTDKALYQMGLLEPVLLQLQTSGMPYSLFTEVLPDPTFDIVEQGLQQYREQNCDGILAIGGGSSIDAAKVIALAASNDVTPQQLVGILKGRKPSVPFFVITTTAGTGSEATIGAVISDSITHKKELVIDTKLVPLVAALDPDLMKGLPPAITAATGLDALTHLVESFLSAMANEESDYYSRSGIQMIFENLPVVFKRGNVIKAREKMALASYYGGLTINIAGLGYVHAFSHQLGSLYGIPHGIANATVLPYVLEFNKISSAGRMAEIARFLGLATPGDNDKQLAEKLVHAVKGLIREVNINPVIPQIKKEDYPRIIQNAFKEANSTYAVPKYMSYDEAVYLLDRVSGR